MKFSFEVPTKYLNHFSHRQDFVFALSFMLENVEYKRYIKRMHDDGKDVIIDNSSNELNRPTDVGLLGVLGTEFSHAKVVAPDWLEWGMMKQLEHAKELARYIPNHRIITPINDIRWMGYYLNEGFGNFAMGYNIRYLNDQELTALKGHHYLGLNSIRELFVGQPASCDTGLPVKLARLNMDIINWVAWGCPHEQLGTDFFDWILTEKELELAGKNMDTLRYIGGLINV